MSKQHIHPSATVAQQVIDSLLGQIAKEHYSRHNYQRYHTHRRQLTHAICWPATWFKQRGIHISHARYQAIIKDQLTQIRKHACNEKAQTYFPNYLLKCLQNHFLLRGDSIYQRYKLLRYSIEIIIEKIPQIQQRKTDQEMIDVLSQAYFITKPVRKISQKKDPNQLSFDLEM